MSWWLFQNVVITAAMAAAIVLVGRVSGARLGPVARHALWLLVLVKFVTPPVIAWPWTIPDPLGLGTVNARATSTPAQTPLGTLMVVEPSLNSPDELMVRMLSADEAAAVTGQPQPAASRLAAVAWPWLLGIWAAGSVIMLSVESVRLARLMRCVRAAKPGDPSLRVRVAELAAHIGVRTPQVLMVPGIGSPAIWAFGRPRLLWPAELPLESTDACIDGLVVHELAHLKRRDHFVGWIELAAGVLWWWNPLFWYVRAARREQAELACDAWVISTLPNGRRAYAESLLAFSGAAVRGEPSMAVLGIRATSRRVLERRLVMIMKGRTSIRLPLAGLAGLALVAAMTLPVWAASQQTPPPPPPPPAAAVKPAPAPPAPPPPPPALPASGTPATAPSPAGAPSTIGVPSPAAVQQATPPTPPTPPAQRKMAPAAPVKATTPPPTWSGAPPAQSRWTLRRATTANLPADGQDLVKNFETQREAILKEADQKIAASQDAVLKALQDLQDKYTKAGKLDEAVAIRDYLRTGGPGRVIRLMPNELNGWVIR